MSARDKILWLLCDNKEHTGYECSKRFMFPGAAYAELLRMESAGIVKSRWESRYLRGPWARRHRLYRLAHVSIEAAPGEDE